jgi:hypothetical protein
VRRKGWEWDRQGNRDAGIGVVDADDAVVTPIELSWWGASGASRRILLR